MVAYSSYHFSTSHAAGDLQIAFPIDLSPPSTLLPARISRRVCDSLWERTRSSGGSHHVLDIGWLTEALKGLWKGFERVPIKQIDNDYGLAINQAVWRSVAVSMRCQREKWYRASVMWSSLGIHAPLSTISWGQKFTAGFAYVHDVDDDECIDDMID